MGLVVANTIPIRPAIADQLIPGVLVRFRFDEPIAFGHEFGLLLRRVFGVRCDGRRTGSQWLPIAKFNDVSIGVANPAVVADRVGLSTRRPDEQALGLGVGSQFIDARVAFDRETQMTEIVRRLGAALDGDMRPKGLT